MSEVRGPLRTGLLKRHDKDGLLVGRTSRCSLADILEATARAFDEHSTFLAAAASDVLACLTRCPLISTAHLCTRTNVLLMLLTADYSIRVIYETDPRAQKENTRPLSSASMGDLFVLLMVYKLIIRIA